MGERKTFPQADETEILARKMPAHADSADARRAAGGDHEAFERLYRAHVGRVYALVRRLTWEGVAEDLTQEVFIRAWQKLGTFRGEARFGTWLHRLAVNHVLSRRKTLRRSEDRHVSEEGVLRRLTARTRAVGAAMDFQTALEKLPDRAKEVLVLYDVEGFAHDEIAELMQISVGTSKSQLHRARMLMREHLEA